MLSRILTLVRRGGVAISTPASPAVTEGSTVDIVAFAADCAVAAQVRLDQERLSDLLNRGERYHLTSPLVRSLDDGRIVELEELDLFRDELLVVQMSGSRGNRQRRVRATVCRVELQVGPYRVSGDLHIRPGTDPLASFSHRQDGLPVEERFEAVAVNRLWVDWIRSDASSRVFVPGPEMPYLKGPLVKDFTGHVLGSE
jgi:hypothetical protein